MPRRLFLALCLFALTACGPEEAPIDAPATSATATGDTAAPIDAASPEGAEAAPAAILPASVADTDAEPLAPEAPASPAGPPSAAPQEATNDLAAGAPAPHTLTVLNATGMTIVAFHMVGCTENEGEPWETMREWTYNYIDAPLAPEASVEIETAAECLITLPVWEDGTEIQEKVLVDGDMTHVITFG